ncbi:hypothetical protein PSPO01_02356 [Paraphaeosphaeria sporulosa]
MFDLRATASDSTRLLLQRIDDPKKRVGAALSRSGLARLASKFSIRSATYRSCIDSSGVGSMQAKRVNPPSCTHCRHINLPGRRKTIQVAQEDPYTWEQPWSEMPFEDEERYCLGITLEELEERFDSGCEFAAYLSTGSTESWRSQLAGRDSDVCYSSLYFTDIEFDLSVNAL